MLEVLYKIRARILRRRVVFNVFDSPQTWPKALLHYKTDPLFNPRLSRNYAHPNNWELMEICRLLNQAGFRVDVVDRSEREWIPDDSYSLVISAAAGNSGQRYPFYASLKLNEATEVAP